MLMFNSYSGTIIAIEDIRLDSRDTFGCNKLFTIEDKDKNIINFVVTPDTYFVDFEMAKEGDNITGFYNSLAPVPLIYPPQFRALIITVNMEENVKVDYFNKDFISSDGLLRLNIIPETQIILENGQEFNQNPADHFLIVVYGQSTRSIPALTNPYEIVVLCKNLS